MRRLLLNLSIALGSFVLTVTFAEGVTRLFWWKGIEGNCVAQDPRLLWRNAANCSYRQKTTEDPDYVDFAFNDCGVRDHRSCTVLRERNQRILCIGDSFTLGASVPHHHTYPQVAERELQRLLGTEDLAVINGGVGGWDLLQYEAGISIYADLIGSIVVLGLMPNDLFYDLADGELERRQRLQNEAPVGHSVASVIWYSGLPVIERIGKQLSARSMLIDFAAYLALHNTEAFVQLYRLRKERSYLDLHYDERWKSKVSQAAAIIGRIARFVESRGAKLVVLFIPQRVQAALLSAKAPEEQGAPMSLYRHLAPILPESVAHFNFIDGLGSVEDPDSLYFPVDGHLVWQGQELLGKWLAGQLQGLLRETP